MLRPGFESSHDFESLGTDFIWFSHFELWPSMLFFEHTRRRGWQMFCHPRSQKCKYFFGNVNFAVLIVISVKTCMRWEDETVRFRKTCTNRTTLICKNRTYYKKYSTVFICLPLKWGLRPAKSLFTYSLIFIFLTTLGSYAICIITSVFLIVNIYATSIA